MSTYLLPISDGNDCWIEKASAHGISDAKNKFVKFLADDYECVDYGGNFEDAAEALRSIGVVVGDVYDTEEF